MIPFTRNRNSHPGHTFCVLRYNISDLGQMIKSSMCIRALTSGMHTLCPEIQSLRLKSNYQHVLVLYMSRMHALCPEIDCMTSSVHPGLPTAAADPATLQDSACASQTTPHLSHAHAVPRVLLSVCANDNALCHQLCCVAQ